MQQQRENAKKAKLKHKAKHRPQFSCKNYSHKCILLAHRMVPIFQTITIVQILPVGEELPYWRPDGQTTCIRVSDMMAP